MLEHGIVISDYDKRNSYLERQDIILNLKKDKVNREEQIEIERLKIEQQKIENIKKKEALEYENCNFLKKIVINYNKKKKTLAPGIANNK